MKYIIIARYGNVTHPELFSDKTEAYRRYAENLLGAVDNMNDLGVVSDLEYPKNFNKEDIAAIKNSIIDLISSVMDKTDNVRKTDNGYAFGWSENYTLEIFKIEEN